MKKYNFDKVVFASDFDTEEQLAFRYLLDFVKPFAPEIHLVCINKSGFFSQPYVLMSEAMKDFQEMAKPLKTQQHFYKDFSVDAGVRHIAEDLGADLVVISNTQRRPLKRMLAGSNVEALVNHSAVPVLTIDFAKAKKNISKLVEKNNSTFLAQ